MRGVMAMDHVHIHGASVDVMCGRPIIGESVRWQEEALYPQRSVAGEWRPCVPRGICVMAFWIEWSGLRREVFE